MMLKPLIDFERSEMVRRVWLDYYAHNTNIVRAKKLRIACKKFKRTWSRMSGRKLLSCWGWKYAVLDLYSVKTAGTNLPGSLADES